MPSYLVPTLDDSGAPRVAHVSYDPAPADAAAMTQDDFDRWHGVIMGMSAPGTTYGNPSPVQPAPVGGATGTGGTVALRSPAAMLNAMAAQAGAAARIKYETAADERKRRAVDVTSNLAQIAREREDQKARSGGWQPGSSLSARDFNTQAAITNAYASQGHRVRIGRSGEAVDVEPTLSDILNDARQKGLIGGFSTGPPRVGG